MPSSTASSIREIVVLPAPDGEESTNISPRRASCEAWVGMRASGLAGGQRSSGSDRFGARRAAFGEAAVAVLALGGRGRRAFHELALGILAWRRLRRRAG